MIMAFRNELALIDIEKSSHRTIEGPFDFARERLNDGKCDRLGRFWVGSMDREGRQPLGALFRVDRDLTVTRIADGFVVSNGIAFSPDDRVMYHTDSRRGLIYAYDFDLAAGAIENRRVFHDFAEDGGRPDGCTIDSEGYLWVCEVDAGRVSRFDPAGQRERFISLPVTRPASVIFGGKDLQHLYIATMSYGLSPEALREQPDAGCLFRADLGVRGLPETSFAG
jgi:sugar lactone lactonase YvrE